MMSSCAPPIIYGRAVDQEKTRHCHQIFSFSNSITPDIQTFHYSVFCSSGKLSSEKLFVENLYDVLTDTQSLQTKPGREKAHLLFSQLMAKIKTDDRSYFEKNIPASAITFDIDFDKGFNLKSIDFRPTQAVMTEEVKCDYAYKNVQSSHPDEDLKMWHDLVMYYKYGQPIERTLFFEDITSTTTDIIQKHMCNYAVKNKLGGIFKIPPALGENGKYPKKYRSQYGSTLDFNKHIKAIGCDKSRAVLPTTACRQPIDSLNLSSLATFKDSGENLLTPTLLQAVINYKMVKPPSLLVA